MHASFSISALYLLCSLMHMFSYIGASAGSGLGLGGSNKKKVNTKEYEKDLPFISCEVCMRASDEIYSAVSEARKQAPYQKLEESEIQDLLGKVCDPTMKEGEWIRHLDTIEKKTKDGVILVLDRHEEIAKCGGECNVIARSCSNLINEEIDQDDLSAALWKNKKKAKDLQNDLCRSWTSRCSRKAKPFNFPRVDEPFEEISEKDLQMEQLMAQMKAAGLGGMSMYNKDDMEDMVANGGFPGYDDAYADSPYGDMFGDGGHFGDEENERHHNYKQDFEL